MHNNIMKLSKRAHKPKLDSSLFFVPLFSFLILLVVRLKLFNI